MKCMQFIEGIVKKYLVVFDGGLDEGICPKCSRDARALGCAYP